MKRIYLLTALLVVFIISLFFDNYIAIGISKIRTPALTTLMKLLSNLGNFYTTLILSLILLLFFVLSKKEKRYLPSLFLSLLISSLIVFLVKQVIQRPRPYASLGIVPVEIKKDFSFPSGHINSVFSVIPFLNKNFKVLNIAWIFLSILVALSRVYLGVHYLSDVIFSMIFGLAFGYFFIYLEDRYNIRKLFKI